MYREASNVDKQICRRIFDSAKHLIENELYNSTDIKITADIGCDRLENGPAYATTTEKEKVPPSSGGFFANNGKNN